MGKYDIAAYVWPAYTGTELRTRIFWPDGQGEWQSVKSAESKFPGHNWPKYPLWGYVDEADPQVMEMEIKEAVSHGVNVFIYDWYWFDNRPFLEQCLDNGFLKAKNNNQMKFYIMWANHDAVGVWDKRISSDDEMNRTVIWDGAVNDAAFDTIIDRVINQYFMKENYYKIDGCPVFMIYDISNFIRGLGGIAGAIKGIERFRKATKAAGFPNLHLQMTLWGGDQLNLSGVDGKRNETVSEVIKKLNIDSLTHYQFCHFADMTKSYTDVLGEVENEWRRIEKTYGLMYFPHISIGWDNNPRFTKQVGPILQDCTPENFKKGLLLAKEYIDSHPNQCPLITINSWNEWTENSYLEPDNVFGYGYLNAVKQVFEAECP